MRICASFAVFAGVLLSVGVARESELETVFSGVGDLDEYVEWNIEELGFPDDDDFFWLNETEWSDTNHRRLATVPFLAAPNSRRNCLKALQKLHQIARSPAFPNRMYFPQSKRFINVPCMSCSPTRLML